MTDRERLQQWLLATETDLLRVEALLKTARNLLVDLEETLANTPEPAG